MVKTLFYLFPTPARLSTKLRCPLRLSTPSTLLLLLLVLLCSPICVRGISYRKKVFGVLFQDGSELWDLHDNNTLPEHLCGANNEKYAGTINSTTTNNTSSVPLNYTCVAAFLAMRNSGLCKGSTFIAVVDAHVVNNNILKILDLLDNYVDVIITKGIDRAPERMPVYKWLQEYMRFYKSFESVLIFLDDDGQSLVSRRQFNNSFNSSSSAPRSSSSNITGVPGLIPQLKGVYKGSSLNRDNRTRNETRESVAILDKGMFMSAATIKSFNSRSYSSEGDLPHFLFWPVSVKISVQPLPSLQMSPHTTRYICSHRRAQFDIVSNVASLLDETHTIDQSEWRRPRREATGGDENAETEGKVDGDGEGEGSSCPTMEGRVAIPLSFIVLFLIVLVLMNICMFSYALSKAAGASGGDTEEEEEEEKSPAPKKESVTKEVKEDQMAISRANNNLKSAPPPPSSEDKEGKPGAAKESTPLLRHNKKKSTDSNVPAPLYKTDSTEFWEIEADHGYNEV